MENEQRIDQYLSGDMTAEQARQFESELSVNKQLRAEVQTQKDAMNLIQWEGEKKLKAVLQDHEMKKRKRNGYLKLLLLFILLIAASVALILMKEPPVESPAEWVVAYFEPYKNPPMARGDKPIDTVWEKATQAYAQGDYSSSAEAFHELEMREKGPRYLAKFYRAVCLLAIEPVDSKTCIELLEEVAVGRHDYVDQATWYLALSYIADQRFEDAKKMLNKLEVKGDYKKEEAKALLDKMDQMEG